MKVILGSSSKQRQDILKMIGLKYEVVQSIVEEESNAKQPNEYVEELSKNKASSVASQINEKAIIITADTVIYFDGKIYEKPKNKEEAFNNIKNMSNKTSYAITIKDLYQDKTITFSSTTQVHFREILDEEIKWYVDNEKNLLNCCGYVPLGKASIFIDKITGDYNTVIGISPSVLFSKLKELGYKISDFEFENQD